MTVNMDCGLWIKHNFAEMWMMKKKQRYCERIYEEWSHGHRTGRMQMLFN